MRESEVSNFIIQFLEDHNLEPQKYVSSVYNKSGTSDITVQLENGKLCYVELKGWNESSKNYYQLSFLQKFFLIKNSMRSYCFYINSKQTLDTFINFINTKSYL